MGVEQQTLSNTDQWSNPHHRTIYGIVVSDYINGARESMTTFVTRVVNIVEVMC